MVQWATGSIGRESIRAFAINPTFELVGVYVTSPDKVGRDAGQLAGIDALGVAATNDIETILELAADCVHYAPLHADVDDMCRILRAGTNIVTPVGFVFPTALEGDVATQARISVRRRCELAPRDGHPSRLLRRPAPTDVRAPLPAHRQDHRAGGR